MKKYILLLIAILFIVIDIRIPAVPYPQYEPFVTEAPQTVDMVVGHVVGDSLRIDLFSDLIGLILLAVACVMLSAENKRFLTTLIWSGFAFALALVYKLMPFYLNGAERFRSAYVLYFVALTLESVALFMAMYSWCGLLESLENHSYNNVTVIFSLLMLATHIVSGIMWFYDLIFLSYAYYLAEFVFLGIALYRIYKDRGRLPGLSMG